MNFFNLFFINVLREVSKYGVFSITYFPSFSPNVGKYGTEKTPYLDTFHAVEHEMHHNDALQYFSAVCKYLVYLFYARVYFQATQCIKYSNIT